jgi:hypothetical protein
MIENKEVNRMTVGAWKRPQSGCVPFVVHLSIFFARSRCKVRVRILTKARGDTSIGIEALPYYTAYTAAKQQLSRL